MATRVVGYVRVSTDRQAEHGASLVTQREKLEAYAVVFGLELVAIVEDAGVSAKTLDRPGLQRALAMLESGEAEALLVTKLDRLTRSVRDLGDLLEARFSPGKSGLLSVGEQIDTRSAAGRMFLNILASISQGGRENIRERCVEGKRAKRARGGFIGGEAPYGFRLDSGELVAVAGEQATIALASQLRAQGLSLRAVATRLAEQGHVSRVGKPFAPTQVARMLRDALPASEAA